MKRILAYGVLAVAALLSSCGEKPVTAPEERKWEWGQPLATGDPPPTECYDQFVEEECPEPLVNMTCDRSWVDFFGLVDCRLTVQPIQSGTSISWRFLGEQGVDVPGPNGVYSWSGPMVESGTVQVDVTVNGTGQTLSAAVTVTRRPGWSWTAKVKGTPGEPPELDSCMSSSAWGLTLSVNCIGPSDADLFSPRRIELANGTGYTAAAVIAGGPNGGLWYVSGTTAEMDLRTQVLKHFRADGPAHPVSGNSTVATGCNNAFGNLDWRNVYDVNNSCVPTPQFTDFLACLWSHEGQHLSAAISSAKSAANDVYALWEPLVGQTQEGLRSAASLVYDDAHTRVVDVSLAAEDAMTSHNRTFWDYASGWVTTLPHPQKC